MKRFIIMAILVLLFGLGVSSGLLFAQRSQNRITDNDYEDKNPQISGKVVVWCGWDGSDNEIYKYDIDNPGIVAVTNNTYPDEDPRISGSNIVWRAKRPGYEYDIFLNGVDISNYPGIYSDSGPKVSGSYVVWLRYDGNDEDVLFYDGTVHDLSNNGSDDWDPQISGSNVVWYGMDSAVHDFDIFLYTAGTVTNISNTDRDDTNPQIDGTNVVWQGEDVSGYRQIFFYDGSSIIQITSTSDTDNTDPQISGSDIVWKAWSPSYYWDLYHYDIDTGATTALTTGSYNGYSDGGLCLNGGDVVWHRYENGYLQIFLHDGTSIYQITNTAYDNQNPRVDGGIVVWQGQYDNPWADNEIFYDDSYAPTLVEIESFTAERGGEFIKVEWETASEIDNAGFHLWRSMSRFGTYRKITKYLIPSRGGPSWGAEYRYRDFGAQEGKWYFYKLQDIDYSGKGHFFGPLVVPPKSEK